jgi:hypothetical protein
VSELLAPANPAGVEARGSSIGFRAAQCPGTVGKFPFRADFGVVNAQRSADFELFRSCEGLKSRYCHGLRLAPV